MWHWSVLYCTHQYRNDESKWQIAVINLFVIHIETVNVCSVQCDARPTVTFPAAGHHRPLTDTKLYCLVTEAHMCEQLPKVVSWKWESNPRPFVSRANTLWQQPVIIQPLANKQLCVMSRVLTSESSFLVSVSSSLLMSSSLSIDPSQSVSSEPTTTNMHSIGWMTRQQIYSACQVFCGHSTTTATANATATTPF